MWTRLRKHSFTIGTILRDWNDKFVQAKNLRVQGVVSIFETKAYGVKEALSWIMNAVTQPMLIETDSLLAIKALDGQLINQLEVGIY